MLLIIDSQGRAVAQVSLGREVFGSTSHAVGLEMLESRGGTPFCDLRYLFISCCFGGFLKLGNPNMDGLIHFITKD